MRRWVCGILVARLIGIGVQTYGPERQSQGTVVRRRLYANRIADNVVQLGVFCDAC